MFELYLDRWGLIPDGEPIVTHTSDLLPVRRGAERGDQYEQSLGSASPR